MSYLGTWEWMAQTHGSLRRACVLHDLGLTDAHSGREPRARCFAVEGARAAHALVGAHGAGEDRARAVAETISLHLNVTVPVRLGPEAHLLSKGVTLDVVGRRLHQVPAETTASVLSRWPRRGFRRELTAATARQEAMRPASRAALLNRLGFAALIDANPLDRREWSHSDA
jgi:hypothetical protein